MGKSDETYMALAIELARRGEGSVEPNPAVGAVLVKGGRIVGRGWHRRFGGPHAEIEAISDAGPGNAKGSTLYISLEPCRHFGKTPPCTAAIVSAGIRKVVYSIDDPNPAHRGGASELKRAGIEVVRGVLAGGATRLNAPFIKHSKTGAPFFTLKWATSLDGKTATRSGDSKWISSDASRRVVREMRSKSCAVMVGIGTVLKDDPGLFANPGAKKKPRRIVVDTAARTPLKSQLVKTARKSPVIIAVGRNAPGKRIEAICKAGCLVLRLPERSGHVDLKALAAALGSMGILKVLVEGGGTLAAGLFDAGLVDKVVAFVAPVVIGGKEAVTPVEGRGIAKMADALRLHDVRITPIRSGRGDADVLVEGFVRR
jgi:diaminohydroxyphosphoribosylaminopyrimidine deaminase/5-amino-6-(5-phosphoribosylamino)uracil reductase